MNPTHPTNLDSSLQNSHVRRKGFVFFKPFYFGNFLLFYLSCTIPNCPEETLLKTNKKTISQRENGQKSWIGSLWRKKCRWPINIWKHWKHSNLPAIKKLQIKLQQDVCLLILNSLYIMYMIIYAMYIMYIYLNNSLSRHSF